MNPYSGNPLRILGLRSDASSKEIARASGRLLKWLEIGEPPQVEELLPFLRPIRRDRESIKHAVSLIENPRDRIYQELFWPAALNSHFQSCCDHLTQGRYNEFLGLCEYAIAKGDAQRSTGEPDAKERVDASLCRHFQAIFYHSAAISTFEAGSVAVKGVRPVADWNRAFQCWMMVCRDDVFWGYLSGRVRQLNDPRLAGFDVKQLRQELPQRLLEVNSSEALAGLEEHKHDVFVSHARVIRNSPFNQAEQERALKKLMEPLVGQFQKALGEVSPLLSESSARERSSSLRQLPTGGFEGVVDADKFMAYFSFVKAHLDKKMMPIGELVLRADLALTVAGSELLDNLAYALRRFSLAVNNVGDLPHKSIELTRIAKRFAKSPECARRLLEDETALQFLILQKEAISALDGKQFDQAIFKLQEARRYGTPEDQKTVDEWIEATKKRAVLGSTQPIGSAPSMFTFNGIGTTLYGRRAVDKATQTYVATLFFVFLFIPVFPIAAYRVRHVGGNQYQFFGKVPLTKWAFLPLVVILALILFMMISNSVDSSSSSYSGTSSPSTSPTSPPSSPSSGSGAVGTGNRYSIEPPVTSSPFGTSQGSPSVSSGKSELSRWLDQERTRLETEEAELDSMKADLERERAVLRNANNMLGENPAQDDVDNYTAMENRFNAKVARFNSLLDRHHNGVQRFNSEVQRYNSMP